nr:ADP-ribosylglycohydrolase family protein [Paraflavitalea speifideiaquila]
MRILPLLFYIKGFDIEKRYQVIKSVSSITHGHIRSVIACFYYLEFALRLLKGDDKQQAYAATAETVGRFIASLGIVQKEIDLFAPLLTADITQQSIDGMPSSGYVMDTLKASMYCFMITNDYKDAVLMAVNLGSDSDTTAAVTGGLAGLFYGHGFIPEHWRSGVKRSSDIIDLCEMLFISLS